MKDELQPGDEVEEAITGKVGTLQGSFTEFRDGTFGPYKTTGYKIKWSSGEAGFGVPATCGACHYTNPHLFHAEHWKHYKCQACQEAGILASWEGCYLCRQDVDDLSRCQDCAMQYCDTCFHTPCHDLCNSNLDKVFHFSSPDCPHWKFKA